MCRRNALAAQIRGIGSGPVRRCAAPGCVAARRRHQRCSPPRCGQHELHVPGVDEGSQLFREAHEPCVFEQPRPERAAVVVAVEAPQMNELMQVAGVAAEAADRILAEPSAVQCRPSPVRLQALELGHLSDLDRQTESTPRPPPRGVRPPRGSRQVAEPHFLESSSLMPAQLARRPPLVVASARHGPDHGCALRQGQEAMACARRKPQRSPWSSRGFATAPGRQRRGLVCCMACNTALAHLHGLHRVHLHCGSRFCRTPVPLQRPDIQC